MSDEKRQMQSIDSELLEILRCPVAVQKSDKGDAGRLELHADCWLICAESGMKYPIRDGIPVMLVEEGERWRDTATAELPIPPPPK